MEIRFSIKTQTLQTHLQTAVETSPIDGGLQKQVSGMELSRQIPFVGALQGSSSRPSLIVLLFKLFDAFVIHAR